MFKTQSILPASYVSPVCKVIDVKLSSSLMQVSGNIDQWAEDEPINPLSF